MPANPKVKTLRDPAYLLWLRDQPCLISGLSATDSESVVAAHLGTGGKGIKSPDNEAIPVLNSRHQNMHVYGEVRTLRSAPDWLIRDAFRALAREMYAKYKADHAGS